MMAMSAEASINIPAGEQCVVIPKAVYDLLLESYTDMKLGEEAVKRMKEPNKKLLTEKEVLANLGITEDAIAAVGDVDLE